jgi:hypothetical protein
MLEEFSLFQISFSEILKEEELSVVLDGENLVALKDIDSLLEGFRYFKTVLVNNKKMDVFVDNENNCAIVEYEFCEYELKVKNAKIRMIAFPLSKLEIYSDNSGEVELIDLRPLLKNKAKPWEEYVEKLYKKFEEYLTRYLG